MSRSSGTAVSKHTAPITEEATLGDRDSIVWSGTAVTYGRARAVVVATGMRTEMGRIAGMLRDAPDEKTPLQKDLDRVGKRMGLGVVGIAIVMITTIIILSMSGASRRCSTCSSWAWRWR